MGLGLNFGVLQTQRTRGGDIHACEVLDLSFRFTVRVMVMVIVVVMIMVRVRVSVRTTVRGLQAQGSRGYDIHAGREGTGKGTGEV